MNIMNKNSIIKASISIIAVFAISLSCCGCGNTENQSNNQIIESAASSDEDVLSEVSDDMYENLTYKPTSADGLAFENLSDFGGREYIIVEGEFLSNAKQHIEDKGELTECGYSIAEFKISKTVYGKAKSSTIKIYDDCYISNDKDGKKYVSSYWGYSPMKKGEKWLYALLANDDGIYTTAARFPLNNDKSLDYAKQVKAINDKAEKLFKDKGIKSSDKLQEKTENAKVYQIDSKYYTVTDKDIMTEVEKCFEESQEIENGLNTKDWGVYGTEFIRLELYTEIVNKFYL